MKITQSNDGTLEILDISPQQLIILMQIIGANSDKDLREEYGYVTGVNIKNYDPMTAYPFKNNKVIISNTDLKPYSNISYNEMYNYFEDFYYKIKRFLTEDFVDMSDDKKVKPKDASTTTDPGWVVTNAFDIEEFRQQMLDTLSQEIKKQAKKLQTRKGNK